MSRLLNANLVRLAKSRVFWLEALGMAGYALFVYVSAVSNMASGKYRMDWSLYFFNELLAVGVAMAVFVSVFLHAQYGDHTIRNRIMVGHGRSHIYLADYLTCVGAGWLLCLSYYVTGLPAGLLLFGGETLRINNLASGLIGSGIIVMVYAALFVLVDMLDQNKARSMAVNIVASLALILSGMQCFGKIVRLGDNAGWLTRTLDKIMPYAVSMHIVSGEDMSAAVLCCLASEAVLLVAAGVLAFRRVDIE